MRAKKASSLNGVDHFTYRGGDIQGNKFAVVLALRSPQAARIELPADMRYISNIYASSHQQFRG